MAQVTALAQAIVPQTARLIADVGEQEQIEPRQVEVRQLIAPARVIVPVEEIVHGLLLVAERGAAGAMVP